MGKGPVKIRRWGQRKSDGVLCAAVKLEHAVAGKAMVLDVARPTLPRLDS